MRTALFFDGKSFYTGWREAAPTSRVDFGALGRWLVQRVGGTSLWAAHYYTGVETGEGGEDEGQARLTGFLDMLDHQPGFFVQRFPRRSRSTECPHCGQLFTWTQEKGVDTTLVADMVRQAAARSFDVAVVASGDADLAPALDAVRALGAKAYVASWGGWGVSGRLRRAAFDHVDLLTGLDAFASEVGASAADVPLAEQEPRPAPAVDRTEGPVSMETVFLRELARAQGHFGAGYVGANYFLTRWSSPLLPPVAEDRRRLLDALVEQGHVEVYEATNGDKALRVASGTPAAEMRTG